MQRIHEGDYGSGRQSSHRMPTARERYDERSTGDLHHGRQNNDRGRNSGRRRRPAFDEELQELYGAVGEAMNFYSGFLQSFQRDVQYVKPYARVELLDHLWMCKVGVTNNKRPAAPRGRRDSDGYHEHDEARDPEATFQEMARLLLEHVKDTIEAAAIARQSREGENASHVYSKLGRTIKELSRQLKHAPMRAKDTEILMTELEMLSTFLAANGADRGTQERDRGHQEQLDRQGFDGQGFDEQGGGEGFGGSYDEGQGTLPTHFTVLDIDIEQEIIESLEAREPYGFGS